MTTHPGDTPAMIAARYGAVARKGLKITVCPPCTFSADKEPVRLRGSVLANNKLVAARDNRVSEMLAVADGTLTRAEAARKLGVKYDTLRRYVRAAKQNGHSPRFRDGEAGL